MSQSYNALIVVSFGGPEGMGEVMPFLKNVLRGKNVPEERMRSVAHHYELFGGVSPINEQNRLLIEALRRELEMHGPHLPIYWGNRNWHPLLADTLREMADDGIERALAFVTSAYSSYSGCRQYRENIEEARAALGPRAPRIEKLRVFYNHPRFIAACVDNVRVALNQVPPERRVATEIVFTAHSIPEAMAVGCDYESQLLESCRLVAERLEHVNWRLVFQSRSGPPQQRWLEPDVCDHLKELKDGGAQDVVVAPIGFISDHMEVLYDLDTEARQLCVKIGLNMVRAATAGTHPQFISMIRDLIIERLNPEMPRLYLGERGASHDFCPTHCCLMSGVRPLSGQEPILR